MSWNEGGARVGRAPGLEDDAWNGLASGLEDSARVGPALGLENDAIGMIQLLGWKMVPGLVQLLG